MVFYHMHFEKYVQKVKYLDRWYKMRKINQNSNMLFSNYDILTKCQENSLLDQHEVLEKNGCNQLGFEGVDV